MSGYAYGEQIPTEECGLCGGHARAEFCDVGVGMVQIEPFHCLDCGAELNPLVNGEYLSGWVLPPSPSSRGERVTGYYITSKGTPIEMTFEDDHDSFNRRAGTSTSELLWRGWIRITKLEGYAIDLPRFMTTKARRALGRVMKTIEAEDEMGDPYVKMQGEDFGAEMPRSSVMSLVSRLPTESSTTEPSEARRIA